jgi:hypothetical protein
MHHSVISPLDLAWEAVNALGGAPADSPVEMAFCAAIGKALDEIEKLGGEDPAPKRGKAGKVIVVGDHDPEYLRTEDAVTADGKHKETPL